MSLGLTPLVTCSPVDYQAGSSLIRSSQMLTALATHTLGRSVAAMKPTGNTISLLRCMPEGRQYFFFVSLCVSEHSSRDPRTFRTGDFARGTASPTKGVRQAPIARCRGRLELNVGSWSLERLEHICQRAADWPSHARTVVRSTVDGPNGIQGRFRSSALHEPFFTKKEKLTLFFAAGSINSAGELQRRYVCTKYMYFVEDSCSTNTQNHRSVKSINFLRKNLGRGMSAR